jgi:hypothetical protein
MLDKKTILENAVKFSTGQTDYQNENFVMNSHVTKYRQVRQALLEIENRYHGIRKIKLDVRRDEIKIKALQRDLEKCEDELEAELIRIDIEDLESDNEIRKRKLHRQEQEIDVFVKRVQDSVENEEDIQRYFDQDPEEERKYWIARMGKQAAMDILSFGRISTGNLDSIAMLPEEEQLQILSIGFQYSNLLGGQLAKIEGKTREYTQQLLSDSSNLRLPTFDDIEDNMELKMINSLKEIVEQKKLNGTNDAK